MIFLRDSEYQTPEPTTDSLPAPSARSSIPSGGANVPSELLGVINDAASHYELPPSLLTGLLYQESRFNPRAVSPAGAKGIAQFMDGTAKEMGVADPFDPGQAIFGAAEYLRRQIDRFDGDVLKGLAAYNAGPGRVAAAVKNGDNWNKVLPPETRDYIMKVPMHADRYRNVFAEAMQAEPVAEEPAAPVAVEEKPGLLGGLLGGLNNLRKSMQQETTDNLDQVGLDQNFGEGGANAAAFAVTERNDARKKINASLAAAGPVDEREILRQEIGSGRSFGEMVADTATATAAGVKQLAAAPVGLVAPGSDLAASMKKSAGQTNATLSPQMQAQLEQFSLGIKNAADEGRWEEVKAAFGGLSPALVAHFTANTLPSMLPVLGAGKVAQIAAAARGASTTGVALAGVRGAGAANAVLNAGSARQDSYDDLKATFTEQGMTPDKAHHAALIQSVLPAAVGGATGYIGGRFGAESDILGGTLDMAAKGGVLPALKAAIGSLGRELTTEQAEELLPKMTTNLLAGRDAFDGAAEIAAQTVAGVAGPGSLGAMSAGRRAYDPLGLGQLDRDINAATFNPESINTAAVESLRTSNQIAPELTRKPTATQVAASGGSMADVANAEITPVVVPPPVAPVAPAPTQQSTAGTLVEAGQVDQNDIFNQIIGATNAAEPVQVVETPSQANGTQAGVEQAAAPAREIDAGVPNQGATQTQQATQAANVPGAVPMQTPAQPATTAALTQTPSTLTIPPAIQQRVATKTDAELKVMAKANPDPVVQEAVRQERATRQQMPQQQQQQQAKARNIIDTAKDSALVAIAKLGGMDTQQLLANGFDQSDISVQKGARVSKKTGQLGKAPVRAKSVGFNLPIHRKGGMSMDGMREALVQRGYLPEDASVNDAIDLLNRELRGEPVYTQDAIESQAAEAEAERMALLEASDVADDQMDFEAESNAELRAINAAYDALSEDNQAFIRGMRKYGASDEEINGYIAEFERVREGAVDGAEASQAGSGESRGQESDFDGEALGGKESAEPDWLKDEPVARQSRTDQIGSSFKGSSLDQYLQEEPGDRNKLNIVVEFGKKGGPVLKGPRYSHIENAVRDGHRVVLTRSGPALVDENMRGWDARDISPAGMRYANWLISQQENQPPTVNATNEAETGFNLAGQTEAEVRAQEAERKAEEERTKREAAEAELAKKDAELQAEVKQRSAAAAETFELGQDAMDNLNGQGGLRFSRVSDVPVGEELVVIHNLSAENLLYADEIGGIPVPSIGITKAASPFTGYGEITLIASNDMVDPKSGTPVFDRDAYTARFPKMNYKKVQSKKADAFYERMKPVIQYGEDGKSFMQQLLDAMTDSSASPNKVSEAFQRYLAPRMMYAKEALGKDIRVPMKPIEPEHPFTFEKTWIDFVKANKKDHNDDAFNKRAGLAARKAMSEYVESKMTDDEASNERLRRTLDRYIGRYVDADGSMNWNVLDKAYEQASMKGKKRVDSYELAKRVEKAVPRNDPAYLKWVTAQMDGLFNEPTITLRGREVAPTLDNIVDAMTTGGIQGAEKTMTFGGGKTAAMLGKRFQSIDEIKAARDQVVSSDRHDEMKKDSEKTVEAYRLKAVEFFTGKDWRGNIDTWAGMDSAMEALAKAGKMSLTDGQIKAALSSKGFRGVSQEVVDLARESIVAIRSAATDYFEAKPQRAVSLKEFKGAVVPKGTDPEVIAALERNGLTVVEYNSKNHEDRAVKVGKLAKTLNRTHKNVLFSFAGPSSATADTHALTNQQATTRIESILGKKVAKVLLDSGLITFVSRGADFQGATFQDGRIILNLDALTEENFAGVLEHEGFHSTVKTLIGEAKYNQLMRQLELNLKAAKGNEAIARAEKAIPADTKPEHRTEELGAYWLEQWRNGAKVPNFIKRWAESFMSALRTAIIRFANADGKLQAWAMNNLKPEDLSNLAIAGLRAKARGAMQGQMREGLAYSIANLPDTITIDGVERPTRNSNGQPIHPTEKWLRNFWRWFSPSPGQLIDGLSVAEVSSLKRDTEALADFIESQSGLPEPDRFTVIPSAVFAHVAGAVNNDKILDAVVRSLPVDVVNFLGGKQGSAKKALNDAAMLEKMLTVNPASDVSLGINPSGIAELLVRVVANAGAKISGLTGGAFERNAAVLADANDPVLGAHVRKSSSGDLGIIAGFGDSNVVDADGRPLVVHHGTNKDFSSFDTSAVHELNRKRMGAYFTSNKKFADTYGGKRLDVYLSIKKPLDIRGMSANDVINALPLGDFDKAVLRSSFKGNDYSQYGLLESSNQIKLREALEAQGFDGVIYEEGYAPAFIAFHPTQIKSATGNNGDFDGTNPDIRYSRATPPASAGSGQGNQNGFALPKFTSTDKWQERIQDRYNRFRDVLKYVRDQGGVVNDLNDFSMGEDRFHGVAMERVIGVQEKLQAILSEAKANDVTMDEVMMFGYAEHAPDRNRAMQAINPNVQTGSGMSDQEAADIIAAADAEGKRATLEALTEKVRDIARETLELQVRSGLTTRAEADAYRAKYGDKWLPLRGFETINENGRTFRGTGQGFNIRGKENLRALGRDSKAGQILENVLLDAERTAIRATKNEEVNLRFLKFVIDNPDQNLWEIDKVKTTRGMRDGMVKEDMIIDKGDGTIGVKVNGEVVYIKVHDDKLFEQLANQWNDVEWNGIPYLQDFSRYLSKSYTAWSPEFALYTNPARDVQAALFSITGREGIGMTGGFVKAYPKALKMAYDSEVRGKDDPLYAEYKKMGGKTGFWNHNTLETKVKEIEALVKDMEATPTGNPFRYSWKMMKALEAVVSNHAGALENATRFASYVAMREAGRSREESAAFAKNLNVNFNRRGTWTAGIGSIVLFFNPAIQGVHNQYETLFKGKHKYQAWALMAAHAAAMGGLAMLAASSGEDDDGVKWWDKIPDYEKERNIIIMLPSYMKDYGHGIEDSTGRYLKIPMPYQWNVGGYLGTLAADVYRNKENPTEGTSAPKAALLLGKSVVTSYVPGGIPPTIAPIVHHAFNDAPFGDGQLYPENSWNKHKPDSEKYTARQKDTPWQHWASFVNEATGGNEFESGYVSIAPAAWKNYVRSYVGGPASFVEGIYDAAIEEDITKAPFLRKMYGEVDMRRDAGKFYDTTEKPISKLKAYKDADKAGSEYANEIAKTHGVLLDLGEMALDYQKYLGKITKDDIAIKDDKSLSSEMKKMKLRKNEKERSDIQEQYLKEQRRIISDAALKK